MARMCSTSSALRRRARFVTPHWWPTSRYSALLLKKASSALQQGAVCSAGRQRLRRCIRCCTGRPCQGTQPCCRGQGAKRVPSALQQGMCAHAVEVRTPAPALHCVRHPVRGLAKRLTAHITVLRHDAVKRSTLACTSPPCLPHVLGPQNVLLHRRSGGARRRWWWCAQRA